MSHSSRFCGQERRDPSLKSGVDWEFWQQMLPLLRRRHASLESNIRRHSYPAGARAIHGCIYYEAMDTNFRLLPNPLILFIAGMFWNMLPGRLKFCKKRNAYSTTGDASAFKKIMFSSMSLIP